MHLIQLVQNGSNLPFQLPDSITASVHQAIQSLNQQFNITPQQTNNSNKSQVTPQQTGHTRQWAGIY